VVRTQSAMARGRQKYSAGFGPLRTQIYIGGSVGSTVQAVKFIAQKRFCSASIRWTGRTAAQCGCSDQGGQSRTKYDCQRPNCQPVNTIADFNFFRRPGNGPSNATRYVSTKSKAEHRLKGGEALA